MDYRSFIALVFCFFFCTCSDPWVNPNSDFKVRDHMGRADALEDSQEYHQAAKEYAIVAERYPYSSYYKAAVRKAALLNIHPANSKTDTNAALHWLNIYLTLRLSPEEKENAQLHIAMLEDIARLQAEISRQDADNSKLRTATRKQSGKITAASQRVKKLEAELAQVRVQLEEMKEVDLRMHTRRVNGNGDKPLESITKDLVIGPEPDSSAASTIKRPDPGIAGESKTIRKKTVLQTDDKGKALHSDKRNPDQQKQAGYPYTVQVGSFTKKEESIREASELTNKGNMGFTSQARIPGKGDWYRVFNGYYRTRDEAQKTALELKKREYPSAFAVKMPFSIRIEVSSDEELKNMEADLKSKGYLGYRIPDRKDDEKIALLIGAFRTKEETIKHLKRLQEAGFKASVVQR